MSDAPDTDALRRELAEALAYFRPHATANAPVILTPSKMRTHLAVIEDALRAASTAEGMRERCAEACDQIAEAYCREDAGDGAWACARAIRALSLSPDPGSAPVEGWESMETAPKDFVTAVDLWSRGERHTDCIWGRQTYGDKAYRWVRYGYDDSNGPVYVEVQSPTHWMPLPPPPADPSRDDAQEEGR